MRPNSNLRATLGADLALALLMPWVCRTNDIDAALAADHLTLFANPANTGADLHRLTRLFLNLFQYSLDSTHVKSVPSSLVVFFKQTSVISHHNMAVDLLNDV